MQGDYIRFNFRLAPELADEVVEEMQRRGELLAVMVPDENRIYYFDRITDESDIKHAAETITNETESIIIRMVYQDRLIIKNCENYFVRENTGLAMEPKVRFVVLSVSRLGDARIIDILGQDKNPVL
jgi:uncharacterized membrane-anchored protein